jgi:hypothetical protein
MKSNILKYAGLNAALTAIYVAFVAAFFSYAPQLFGEVQEKNILIPITMLLVFILSASITGGLVLGRPILWYLDGKKKDAVLLFVTTIAVLFVFTVLAFSSLVLFYAN